jgi:hypothetical protein
MEESATVHVPINSVRIASQRLAETDGKYLLPTGQAGNTCVSQNAQITPDFALCPLMTFMHLLQAGVGTPAVTGRSCCPARQ